MSSVRTFSRPCCLAKRRAAKLSSPRRARLFRSRSPTARTGASSGLLRLMGTIVPTNLPSAQYCSVRTFVSSGPEPVPVSPCRRSCSTRIEPAVAGAPSELPTFEHALSTPGFVPVPQIAGRPAEMPVRRAFLCVGRARGAARRRRRCGTPRPRARRRRRAVRAARRAASVPIGAAAQRAARRARRDRRRWRPCGGRGTMGRSHGLCASGMQIRN